MIKIVAKCTVKPEKINCFIAEANILVEASRREAGCISYNLYQDIHNPIIITFIEEWENEEAISTHNKSESFMSIVSKLELLQMKKTEVNLYKEI